MRVSQRPRAATTEIVIGGIRLSHPDRVIYPDLGWTKADVARYYEAIGRWILPHVKGRPLTLVHCPKGLGGPCAYMRHSKVWGPSVLRRVRIQERTKLGEYLVADSRAAVISLAQMGVLEIHTWNSTTDDVERPNRIVWDLDPGPAVTWSHIATAAKTLRRMLEILHLEAWVKTTGGRGLHVVVPLRPERDWSECLSFARDVAQALERSDPAAFTTAYAKRGREHQILIDYLRNNRTNTSIAAFSTRARPGAPVSTPVAWKEIAARPPTFTVRTVLSRVARLRSDPWEGYWRTRQHLTNEAVAAVRSI